MNADESNRSQASATPVDGRLDGGARSRSARSANAPSTGSAFSESAAASLALARSNLGHGVSSRCLQTPWMPEPKATAPLARFETYAAALPRGRDGVPASAGDRARPTIPPIRRLQPAQPAA